MVNQDQADGAMDLASPEARAGLAALDASWNALLAVLDGIPETSADLPGVCGAWSIRTLLGHIAFWDRFSLNRARNALAGNAPMDVAADPLNEEDERAHAGHTLAENRATMREAHAEVVAFIASVDPASPRFTEMLRHMSVDTIQHYDEHASQIRAWRTDAPV